MCPTPSFLPLRVAVDCRSLVSVQDDRCSCGPAYPFVRKLLACVPGGADGGRHLQLVRVSHAADAAECAALEALHALQLPLSSCLTLRRRGDTARHLTPHAPALYLSALPEPAHPGLGVGCILAAPGAQAGLRPQAELCVAFDFDGVLADASSERYFQAHGLAAYREHERACRERPMAAGPMLGLYRGLQDLRDLGTLGAVGCRLGCRLRLYVVTARGGPAVQRVATSMQAWGLRPDGIHYLNGTDKQRFVGDTLQADVFFDDQLRHLQPVQDRLLAVHVPGLEAPVGDT